MCGIAGVVGRDEGPDLISRMIEIMRHRGPDSEGYYKSEEIQLGHCRLAINDLSERANQPFQTPDETVAIVVNGEIYNFKDIKEPLEQKGYQFRSGSDCEVVLHAYLDRGLEFIYELNGMFALAIWDGKKKTLFLARDRLGIKPLYYTRMDHSLLFASEIKALASCRDVELSLDHQSFAEYLFFENYFGNRTLNRAIKLVEPGQIVIFDARNRSLAKNYFWQPVLHSTSEDHMENIYDGYLKRIESSVNRHLISDVPLGCYLSSGIDSSSVTYYASKKLNGHVKTYTGYFGIDGFYDEATPAQKIARQLGCLNQRVDIGPKDFVDHIENILFHLDEPRVGMGSFSQYMVAKKAAKEVKVILTGHGGDEFFAGYPVFKSVYSRKNLFRLLLSSTPRELMYFVYFSVLPLFRKELRYFLPCIFSLTSLKNILQRDFFVELEEPSKFLEEPDKLRNRSADPYEQLFLTYLTHYLPALFIVEDKISMAFSLESRTPLCDNDMLDFALGIPLSEKLRGYELKHIPRKSMQGKLPDFIYKLPKRGFPTPLHRWFKKELRDYVKSFILDNISWIGMFRREAVERMISAYQGSIFEMPHDEIRAHRIWILLNLVVYFRNQKNRYQRS